MPTLHQGGMGYGLTGADYAKIFAKRNVPLGLKKQPDSITLCILILDAPDKEKFRPQGRGMVYRVTHAFRKLVPVIKELGEVERGEQPGNVVPVIFVIALYWNFECTNRIIFAELVLQPNTFGIR